MAETVKEDKDELVKFRKQIPAVAQMLVGRWKDKLYDPRAGCLEPQTFAVGA